VRFIVPAVAAGLVTAGCGADEGVTRAEWARDADAICAKYDRRFRSLRMADELPALVRVLERAIELLESERAELNRLEAPEGDEPEIGTMLGHLDKAVAAGRRAQVAARRGDVQAATIAVGESDSAAAQAQHIARDLGADTCAKP
jgi:hypothetical protein